MVNVPNSSKASSEKEQKRQESLEEKLQNFEITPLQFLKSHAHTNTRLCIGDSNDSESEGESEDRNNNS